MRPENTSYLWYSSIIHHKSGHFPLKYLAFFSTTSHTRTTGRAGLDQRSIMPCRPAVEWPPTYRISNSSSCWLTWQNSEGHADAAHLPRRRVCWGGAGAHGVEVAGLGGPVQTPGDQTGQHRRQQHRQQSRHLPDRDAAHRQRLVSRHG